MWQPLTEQSQRVPGVEGLAHLEGAMAQREANQIGQDRLIHYEEHARRRGVGHPVVRVAGIHLTCSR